LNKDILRLFNEVIDEGANITNLVTISATDGVKLAMEAHYGWLDPWNLKYDMCKINNKVGKYTANQVNYCIVPCQFYLSQNGYIF
jgi:hypothetical protein